MFGHIPVSGENLGVEVMSNEEDLRKKIERLESENAELRSATGSQKRYAVTEGEYKGHPTLTFNGPGLRNPLSLGLGKLRAIEAGWQHVVRFLAKHPAPAADKAAQQDDDRI